MARHNIDFEVPRNVVRNTDVEFVVHSNDERLGKLGVSRGSVSWIPANHSTAFHLTWERFDELIRERGRPRPAR